ncbi:MAG TPA: type IX secretion system sortase PorU [Bacteroidia bacterium]|nr:type IX secretion system sortase PorU [Bacteroidia bacterium]
MTWAQQFMRLNLDHRELRWTTPLYNRFTETESKSFLWFDEAQYDPSRNFLPYFFERKEVYSNAPVTARLENAVYETLDPNSVAVIGSQASQIGSDPEINAYVTNSREHFYSNVRIVPLRRNPATGSLERLVSFDLKYTALPLRQGPQMQVSNATTSVLASGTWYRIGVVANGVHKLDYNFLNSMGIDMATLDPRNIRIYGNGRGQISFSNYVQHADDLRESSIQVGGESDGVFDEADYVLFYGVAPHTWAYDTTDDNFHHHVHDYCDTTYYFLNTDLGPGMRIQGQPTTGLAPTHTVNSFDDYGYHEYDNENLIKSGRTWYGEKFDIVSSFSFAFSFPNIETGSLAWCDVDMVSRLDSQHPYDVTCQSANTTLWVGAAQTNTYYAPYAIRGSQDISFMPTGPVLTVTVTRPAVSSNATGWLNWIEVNVRRQLRMSGSQMGFRDVNSVGVGNVAEYHLSNYTGNTVIWDVTDYVHPAVQQVTPSSGDLVWSLPADSMREFQAFEGAQFLTPVNYGAVPNQNLHALEPVDYIIVAHPLFLEQAQELAQLHADHDTLTSVIVTPQQIYNEFSSGAQDVTAIRDFVKMLYDRATTAEELPKYLLLLGDGSYDHKYRLPNNTNFIPTFQNINALGLTESYVSDEFFGLLNDSGEWDSGNDVGDCDIGIGRFPVQSAGEAQEIVDKIRFYMTRQQPIANAAACSDNQCGAGGEWRNTVVFIGDDEDSNIHMSQADQMATMIDTGYNNYNIDKIYLDAYQQEQTPGGERYPTVNEAITKKVNRGCLIMNYTGHGGEVGLGHERVVEVQQINSWDNLCNMPLFVTATCEFARYDDPGRTSAGEYVILNENGGGIALFTTVRLVYSTPNFILNRNFYRTVFEPINGEMPHIGDVYRITKDISGNSINNRNFTLLGDPALKLNYPVNKVVTTEINSQPVNLSQPDTLSALSRVTIKGYVADTAGNQLGGFNGILYPTVFDKPATITTLQNDPPNAPFVYRLQRNVLYHGKVSVINGNFEFSFVVPRDISYQYGIGRISYYAEDGITDATGYYENLVIGGSNINAPVDNIGPGVRLFMNDSLFVAGGITDESPKLFAMIIDSNGVNTVGNGIGHDIVAVLDEETDHAIVLNDYYQSNINSYQSGTIIYPFADLAEGTHTLSLKVWDVYNNSTTVSTEFVVQAAAGLKLDHVLNYPNPFTTTTSFFFEHNQCCTDFDVMVQVFTVSGKLVKTINEHVYSEGYRSDPITWDGTDDYGDKIGRGVYIYRMYVRTADGMVAEHYEKLVIL